MSTVTAEIFVHAPVKQAYRAFTNATSLREWLCDVATVEPHPRGRMYLWWRGDFYSSGHYLELDADKRVKFRWYSNLDPAPTAFRSTDDRAGGPPRSTHGRPTDAGQRTSLTAHPGGSYCRYPTECLSLPDLLVAGADPGSRKIGDTSCVTKRSRITNSPHETPKTNKPIYSPLSLPLGSGGNHILVALYSLRSPPQLS